MSSLSLLLASALLLYQLKTASASGFISVQFFNDSACLHAVSPVSYGATATYLNWSHLAPGVFWNAAAIPPPNQGCFASPLYGVAAAPMSAASFSLAPSPGSSSWPRSG